MIIKILLNRIVSFFNPKRLDTMSFTTCMKDLQLYHEHHDPLTVYYIAFGGKGDYLIDKQYFQNLQTLHFPLWYCLVFTVSRN